MAKNTIDLVENFEFQTNIKKLGDNDVIILPKELLDKLKINEDNIFNVKLDKRRIIIENIDEEETTVGQVVEDVIRHVKPQNFDDVMRVVQELKPKLPSYVFYTDFLIDNSTSIPDDLGRETLALWVYPFRSSSVVYDTTITVINDEEQFSRWNKLKCKKYDPVKGEHYVEWWSEGHEKLMQWYESDYRNYYFMEYLVNKAC